eukprot:TRINITY_DN766_c0_g1_i1.p2 TRINITY_DN766_c0_g1~~TRINITY_DN766_c0_g1_i1.p2  ORF type:complete len:108 (-),score=42.96 TRINITY_DN766_c0_g1_i1:69-392(-)
MADAVQEFAAYLESQEFLDNANAKFDEVDANRSGSIDKNELLTVLQQIYEDWVVVKFPHVPPPTAQDAEDAMRDLDRDGNGNLDRAEFAQFVKSILTVMVLSEAQQV